MLKITNNISIPLTEITIKSIRAQGPGGQNVNKVSSAIHLSFDVNNSSLPESYKKCLTNVADSRLSSNLVFVIKSQEYRTRSKNLTAAYARLKLWIQQNTKVAKRRYASKPKRSSIEKRLKLKKQRSRIKSMRNKNNFN